MLEGPEPVLPVLAMGATKSMSERITPLLWSRPFNNKVEYTLEGPEPV